MRTIIVDDEPRIAEDLAKVIQLVCPRLQLLGTAFDFPSAEKLIRESDPQLVFLDVEVGDRLSTNWLQEQLPVAYKVIFVTAHDKYAARAFRLAAADYLLKPVDPLELIQATDRVLSGQQYVAQSLDLLRQGLNREESQKIMLADNEGVSVISMSDIIYCKASGSYCEFYLEGNRKITASRHLKYYEELLNQRFLRVHRSYLVNTDKISRIDSAGGALVTDNGSEVPFTMKQELIMEAISNKK